MTLPAPKLPENNLTQIFNESAARHHEAFPERLANLLVSTGMKKVYVSPEIAAHLTENIAEVGELLESQVTWMSLKRTTGMSGKTSIADQPVNFINMNPARPSQTYVSDKHPAEMNIIALFDHELGHLVVKEGWCNTEGSSLHIAECAADAYAVLRHLQRFGGTTDIFAQAPRQLAETVIFSSPIHYTSGVIEEIARLHKSETVNPLSLSLTETAVLAGKIAREHSLSEQTLDKIWEAYAPVRKCGQTIEGRTKMIRLIADIINQNKNDRDICRAGELFLNRSDVKKFIASKMPPNGPRSPP